MAMQGNKTQDNVFVSWNVYRMAGSPPTPQTLDYFPVSGAGVAFGLTVRSDVAGSGGDITNVKAYLIRSNTSGAIGEIVLKKESSDTVSSGTNHTGAGFTETPSTAVYDGYIYIGLRFVVTLRSGAVITIDQNPVGFINSSMSNTPTLTTFTAKRCNASGVLSDEGQYVRNTIKGAIAPGMGWTVDDHTLRVGYRLQGSADPFTWIVKTGFTAEIDADEKLDTAAVFAAGSIYEIRCELTNNERSITAYSVRILPKAFANLHLSGSGYGVGVGQYSITTEQNPKFECAYPAHFYGGIRQMDYSLARVDTGAKWMDRPIYRKVLLFGAVAAGATVDIPIGESAIAEVIHVEGMFIASDGARGPIPWAHQSSAASQMRMTVQSIGSSPYVRLMTGSGQSATGGHIVIQYILTGNLLPPGATQTLQGVTFTVLPGGGLRLSGTCNAPAGTPAWRGITMNMILNGKYRLSAGNSTAIDNFGVRLYEAGGLIVQHVDTNVPWAGATFTLANRLVEGWTIRFVGGVTYDAVIFPWLEQVN